MSDPVLAYASISTADRQPPRIDFSILILATIQLFVSAVIAYNYLLQPGGYDELGNPKWYQHVSWRLLDLGTLAAWCGVAAVIAFGGAVAVPSKRSVLFVIYAISLSVLLLLVPLSLLAVDEMKFRWVSTRYGTPEPQAWRTMVSESVFYFQIPLMILICNPAYILLIGRTLFRGRSSNFP